VLGQMTELNTRHDIMLFSMKYFYLDLGVARDLALINDVTH
jgi:hypothetical protein